MILSFVNAILKSAVLKTAQLNQQTFLQRETSASKWKTATYMKYSAPLIYASKEEMDKSLAKQEKKAIDPEFILLRDTEEMFVWDGETLTPYEGRFNKSDYLTKDEDTLPLKFEFLVDNRPV